MSRATDLVVIERMGWGATFPDDYADGEVVGLGKPPPGPRDRGGYPIHFARWSRDRRRAWLSGLVFGCSERARHGTSAEEKEEKNND